MRAAVLHSIEDSKFDIRDDVEAVGPGPGQVRIRVRAAGVCHSDLSARNGGLPQPLPAILGHEAAGDVIAVGDGVTGLAVGDRVIASWLPPCGSCPSCLRGQPYLCMTHVIAAYVEPRFLVGGAPAYGLAGCGAFAEEMVLPQEGAVKFAADVPYELAALVGCGVVTGVGAVINTARVEPGATVAVIGCGGVGTAVIQGARLSGAAVIAAVDPVESKHEAARSFGATHAVHPDNLGELSAELTGGEGFDYAFEVVGTPQTIRAAWTAARRGGTVVIVGAGRADEQVEFTPFELLFDGKKMLASLYGSADVQRDYPRMLGLWRTGRLDLGGMVTQRLKLDDIDQALAAAAVEAFGRLDIVVNNVGGAMPRPFLATTPRHLESAFRFNVVTAHSLTQAAVPHLLASGADGGTGSVISITSAVGRAAGRGYLAYGTAKAALAHYTRLAAADLAPRIRVNAIAVGAVATSALDIVLTDDTLRGQMERATPLGRIGDPADIAAAVVFLASPAGGYITGKIIEVDGGIDRPNLDLGIPDL